MGGGGGGRKRLVGESFAAFPSMVMTPEVIRVRDKPDAERPLKGFTSGMWGQREVKITPGVVLGVNGRYPELPVATVCSASVSCSIVPAIPQHRHTSSSWPPSLCPAAEGLEEKHLRVFQARLYISFLFSQGADSLLDGSSEADQQDLLVLLQAKVASLTLHNKELQDKLQVGKHIADRLPCKVLVCSRVAGYILF